MKFSITTIMVLAFSIGLGLTTLAADWTTPVPVSSRSGVFDVELAKDPATDYLFAAVAYSGDGLSVNFSTDDGQTWTETYNYSPASLVIFDISVAQCGNYFYVAMAQENVCVLIRFNATTGAQVSWAGASFILLAPVELEEVVLMSPENLPSTGMQFVGHSSSADNYRLYYADSYNDMSTWNGAWQSIYGVKSGLAGVSVYNDQLGLPFTQIYISFIDAIEDFEVYYLTIPVGSWDQLDMGPAGPIARFTSISAVGIPGFGGRLYYVYEMGSIKLIATVGWIDDPDNPTWTYDILETSGSIYSPAISACYEGGVGLAYTKSWGSTITIVQGKYEQYPWFNFFSLNDGPNETYASTIPAFEVQPDILQTCGAGHGVIYVRHSTPRYAYYTHRTVYCGEFTSGYAGNTDCSSDGKRNLADITRLIDRVYISKLALCLESEGNTDGDADDKVNLADITRLIDHVFISKVETAVCR